MLSNTTSPAGAFADIVLPGAETNIGGPLDLREGLTPIVSTSCDIWAHYAAYAPGTTRSSRARRFRPFRSLIPLEEEDCSKEGSYLYEVASGRGTDNLRIGHKQGSRNGSISGVYRGDLCGNTKKRAIGV